MSKYKFDRIVYIGRFQPLHRAHVTTIKTALSLAEQVVIVIGSAEEARNPRNPFTFVERMAMIQNTMWHDVPAFQQRVKFVAVENHKYNNTRWAVDLAKAVAGIPAMDHQITRQAIIGGDTSHDKDAWYINLFPQWEPIRTPNFDSPHAVAIREVYFTRGRFDSKWFEGVCPDATVDYLRKFRATPAWEYLTDWVEFVDKYQKPYKQLPYPVSFNTVDACVIKSGHVLMIRRGRNPGKGLLALPGGFLDADIDLSLEDAMIRELFQETNIDLPERLIRKSIVYQRPFDAIDRDPRGRIITQCYKIMLDSDGKPFPKVTPGDDANEVSFIPIASVPRHECYGDHYDMIDTMVARTVL